MSFSLLTLSVEYIGEKFLASEDKREYGHRLSPFHLMMASCLQIFAKKTRLEL